MTDATQTLALAQQPGAYLVRLLCDHCNRAFTVSVKYGSHAQGQCPHCGKTTTRQSTWR